MSVTFRGKRVRIESDTLDSSYRNFGSQCFINFSWKKTNKQQTTNKQIISFYHLFVFIVVANVFIVYFICVCERSFLKSFAPFPADLLNKFNLIVLAKQGINSWQAIKSSIYFRPWLRFFLVIIILMTCVCWSFCRR